MLLWLPKTLMMILLILSVEARAAKPLDPGKNAELLATTHAMKLQILGDDAARQALSDVQESTLNCAEALPKWFTAVKTATDAHTTWMESFKEKTGQFIDTAPQIDSWPAFDAYKMQMFSLEQELPSPEDLHVLHSIAVAQLLDYGNLASDARAKLDVLNQRHAAKLLSSVYLTDGCPATDTVSYNFNKFWYPDLTAYFPSNLRPLRRPLVLSQQGLDNQLTLCHLLNSCDATAAALRRSRDEAATARVLLSAQLQTRSRLLGRVSALRDNSLRVSAGRLHHLDSTEDGHALQRSLTGLSTEGRLMSQFSEHSFMVDIMCESLLSPLTALRLERQHGVELEDIDCELEIAEVDEELEARIDLLMVAAHRAHDASLAALTVAKADAGTYRRRRLAKVDRAQLANDAPQAECLALAQQVEQADHIASEEAYREYVQICIAK